MNAHELEQCEWMKDEIASLEHQLDEEKRVNEMLVIERDDALLKIHDAYEVFANMDGGDFSDAQALARVIHNIVDELKPPDYELKLNTL